MFWLIPIAIGAAALLSSGSSDDSSSSYDDSAEREEKRRKEAAKQQKKQLSQEIAQFCNAECNKLAHKLGNATYNAPYYEFTVIKAAIQKQQAMSSLYALTQEKIFAGSHGEQMSQQLAEIDKQLAELRKLKKHSLAAHQYIKTLQSGSES